jgi:hypothetical protein
MMNTAIQNEGHGYAEGEKCNRKGCAGVIDSHRAENCSCHLCAPCGACTAPRGFCPECDWEEADEEVINDYVVQVDRQAGVYKSWEPRPLDRTKIDWRTKPHSNASMICEGVFPLGTAAAEVRKLVDGTFGGRFERFDAERGEFRFIAYTD